MSGIDQSDLLTNMALQVKERLSDVPGSGSLIEKIHTLVLSDRLDDALNILGNRMLDKSVVKPDESRTHAIWNFIGFFFIQIKESQLSEKIYQKFYETLLKNQVLDKKRYHKGLPLHNLGLSIELQADITRAVRFYEAAYIEDVISTDKASIGAPAYRNLRYRLGIDERELKGIYAIATREPGNDPFIILARFDEDRQKWISIGLALEYVYLDKNYLSILLSRAQNAKIKKEKKETLEALADYMFSGIQGFTVHITKKTATSDLDRIIRNRSLHPDIQLMGPYILLESKNWNRKVTSKETQSFATKLERHQCQCGVLLSRLGVSGPSQSEITTARNKGHYIMEFNEDDIKRVIACENLIELLIQKFEAVKFG